MEGRLFQPAILALFLLGGVAAIPILVDDDGCDLEGGVKSCDVATVALTYLVSPLTVFQCENGATVRFQDIFYAIHRYDCYDDSTFAVNFSVGAHGVMLSRPGEGEGLVANWAYYVLRAVFTSSQDPKPVFTLQDVDLLHKNVLPKTDALAGCRATDAVKAVFAGWEFQPSVTESPTDSEGDLLPSFQEPPVIS